MHRHDLAGIREFQRIKHSSRGSHGRQCVAVKHQGHIPDLVAAHAVLAGYRSAGIDARLHYGGRRGLNALDLLRVTGVEVDIGVQVPIAGMKYVGDRDSVFVGNGCDRFQHMGKDRPGNDRVLHHEVGADAPEGPERFLAPLPQARSLVGSGRQADGACAVISQDLLELTSFCRNGFLVPSVDFGQQHCRGIGGISGGVNRCFHGSDAPLIHHLEGGRYDAGSDDRRDSLTGRAYSTEAGKQCFHRLWNGRETHGDARGDTEHPLAADKESYEIISPSFASTRSQRHDVAARQHHFQLHDVVGGYAVLEAVGTAGVFRDVAS